MRRLDLSRRAHKFLESLPARQFRQVAMRLFDWMRDASPHDCRPLVNSSFYRVDIGEYRIVYRIEGDAVLVAVIGKRNDDEVYRELQRL